MVRRDPTLGNTDLSRIGSARLYRPAKTAGLAGATGSDSLHKAEFDTNFWTSTPLSRSSLRRLARWDR